MPDKNTETVAKESDGDSGAGLCTTVTGIIMKEGDKVDAPTGDLIFTRRDTSGKKRRIHHKEFTKVLKMTDI